MARGDLETMSPAGLKKRLRRSEEALRRVAETAKDAGKGLPYPEAQKAREETVAVARKARSEVDAVRHELAQREALDWKPTFFDRLRAQPSREEVQAARDKDGQERVEFNAKLKAEQEKRNAEALERRRVAGLVYEPTGSGGGDVVAALFSSTVLWEFTEMKIRSSGLVAQILTARHLLALYWVANLIAEHGGESATIAAGTSPHWPGVDGDVHFREHDLSHLVTNKFIEIDREIGSGGSVTYRFGSRTKALVAGFREHWTAL